MILSTFLVLLTISLSFSYNLSKLDPILKKEANKKKSSLKFNSYKEIIKVKVLTKDGKVRVVDLSKRDLESLASDDNILYIEAPRRLRLYNDIAFSSSYVVWGSGSQDVLVNYPDTFFGYIRGGFVQAPGCQVQDSYFVCNSNTKISVSSGGNYRLILGGKSLKASHITGGNVKYLVGTKASQSEKTGEGVIVGIVDTGINFCHPAFRKQDGTTRILFYRSYKGYELNSSQVNQRIREGNCNYDDEGHGTAVAGVAGGYWSQTRFNSQAKDVSFIVYQTNLYDTDIMAGIDYIKSKAKSLQMPAVVNLSLGGHFDPHDGTSLFDKFIDQVSENGFVVVVSAGNEGNEKIHAQVWSGNVNLSLTETEAVIDGWYTKGSSYRVGVCDQSGFSCLQTEPETSSEGLVSSCYVYIDNTTLSSPLNGDGEVFILIVCGSKTSSLKLNLKRLSGDGKMDLWIANGGGSFMGGYEEDGFGGYKYTVSSPGTAKRAITVGAIGGDPISVRYINDFGRIAFFSSRGPTRDGRIKPDIVADGFFLCTANYTFTPSADPNSCSSDGYYTPLAGTSFSSPVITALAALYLQDNPNSTPEQVKSWLTSNAVYDTEGNPPNVAYGYGKAVWPESPPPPPETPPSPPSPEASGGGGGCSMGYASPINALLWLLIPAFIFTRRRWKA